ncbi:hypothetical protein EG346_20360 [Chryseobacterium carnipullorum]|uniref:HTH luxR-type domain-containing protein n=1 Tax=Chryseobacterium carnipullorum TaxID=1124835 RepID=A0A3G6MAC0_CHRCU|nr:hypothetical protein [Chryseobacterium carnipullorum]AZA50386.1 hypothetical protein EG346_20360 [Chryseobacterium carnipullorum]
MITKFLSCLFFFSLFFYSFSQRPTEQSLKNIIFDIGFSTAGSNEIKKIDRIISICHRENYKDCEVFGYLKIANIYNKNNDIKKAFYYTDLVEKKKLITSDTDFEAVFYFHTIRSLLHQKLGERIKALKLLDEVAVRAKGKPYFEYLLEWQYAGIYNEMNEKDKALEAYKKAYLESKKYRENYHSESEKSKNKLANSYKPTAYLSGMYLEMGKMDSARIYIEEALRNGKKIDEKGIQYITSIYAAKYYFKANDLIKAQHHLWICKSIAVHYYKSENYQKAVIGDLINLYEKMGEKDSADYYSRQLLTVQSINDAQNKVQRDLLDEKQAAEERGKTEEKNKLIYLCVALLLSMAFIVLYFFYFKKRKSINVVPTEIVPVRNNDLFEQVTTLAKENSPEFLTRFNDYCPGFSEKLVKAADLKNSEIAFCAFLYLNFSTKDIAAYTYTSVRTVQTKKYRLRKKLNIPNETDTYIWFRDLMK